MFLTTSHTNTPDCKYSENYSKSSRHNLFKSPQTKNNVYLLNYQFCRSEYGAFWKCVQAGGIYVFTQLVKMLALATFFPTADNDGQEGFDLVGVSIITKFKKNCVFEILFCFCNFYKIFFCYRNS